MGYWSPKDCHDLITDEFFPRTFILFDHRDKVVKIAVQALIHRTKDLQIAAWLTEALTMTAGFDGLADGLRILGGFMREFWDHVYPEIEEGDLEYRIGPLEYLDDKLPPNIRHVPLTDSRVTSGYPWLKWQESRQVGYESSTRNQYGDVEETKKRARDDLIAEGKITAEDFDAAVAHSKRAYYEPLVESLNQCIQEFEALDETLDEKFGREAPKVSDIREVLKECNQVLTKILKEKREKEPDAEPEAAVEETVAEFLFKRGLMLTNSQGKNLTEKGLVLAKRLEEDRDGLAATFR